MTRIEQAILKVIVVIQIIELRFYFLLLPRLGTVCFSINDTAKNSLDGMAEVAIRLTSPGESRLGWPKYFRFTHGFLSVAF